MSGKAWLVMGLAAAGSIVVACSGSGGGGPTGGGDCYTQAWLNVSNETCAGELAGVSSQYPGATMSATCPP